ncbi:metal ABC transporter solute-binding protein, Zn/Mn family [Labrys wisconsinensis]|uniref:Zinc/manganese transport system substrate-binding protein n=1 Tax=Labrys wisconsinensis TaxID=425677 RepID=A0ABU0JJ07_9HYPH|nr:zinc ABC transporter substrate-binding protein [Labrys wisconsinensis]MDQ0473117.1 zinc/manganese transport system substrate-binding protein [Labrys wisconsinensis]
MRTLLLALALTAALPGLATGARAADRTAVVAAENFYGELAEQIGGKHVAVTSILSNPDQDPHLFESSTSTAKAIDGAAIVIYNGVDYDPWMDKLLAASSKPDRVGIVAADLVGAKSGDNPHLWYKPETFPAVAKALAAALEQKDPAHAAEYKANLAKFEASLAPIAKQIAAVRQQHADTAVTATEPVFGYMAEALGFKMLNYEFQVATMNDTEPSPSQVAAFEQSLKDGSAKILFYNSQVTDETTKRLLALAKDNKVAVVGVTETEPKGKTLQTWFKSQLEEVQQALSPKSQ